jgi:hypothetical protein
MSVQIILSTSDVAEKRNNKNFFSARINDLYGTPSFVTGHDMTNI